MKRHSLVSLFGLAAFALLDMTSPSLGEVLRFERLFLACYDTALAQNGTYPNGRVVKVTGTTRDLARRKPYTSADRRVDFSIHTIGQAPAPLANEAESVKPVFQRAIPTIPGKNLTAVVVSYPPGGKSPSHHHAKSAFIYAFVLSGAVWIGIGGQRPAIYRAGDSFYEEPGAHHTVSENASASQPASLLAIFIADAEDHPLTLPDASTEGP